MPSRSSNICWQARYSRNSAGRYLYWTADSYRPSGLSQGRGTVSAFGHAAESFLHGPVGADRSLPGGTGTRKAGFIEDARNLYRGLLNATHDAARQAVLEHDLQQLMLLPAKTIATGKKGP